MAAVTICSNFGAQENKVCHVSIVSLSICHKVMGLDATIFVFWMLCFKPTFSTLLFAVILEPKKIKSVTFPLFPYLFAIK